MLTKQIKSTSVCAHCIWIIILRVPRNGTPCCYVSNLITCLSCGDHLYRRKRFWGLHDSHCLCYIIRRNTIYIYIAPRHCQKLHLSILGRECRPNAEGTLLHETQIDFECPLNKLAKSNSAKLYIRNQVGSQGNRTYF